jgi:BioD-like phosphotransacetylase family protein
MAFLFIGTTGDHAGQSLLTWAIARRLVERGLSVGFLKPFGTNPVPTEGLLTDHDALLFKKVLDLQQPLDQICPSLVSEEAWKQMGTDEILAGISSLAQDLSVGRDVLLIMGSKHIFFDNASCPIPDIALATELNALFILVNRYRETSRSLYSILFTRSMLRHRIKGIILNRVPPDRLGEIKDQVIPSLSEKGIPITLAIPEDPLLSFQSLREIGEILNAEILFGVDRLSQPVGQMTVGASDLTGGLMLFKRVYNKIILLEPFPLEKEEEEPPVHRAIAGILLTGGRRPAPQILKAAEQAGIPLMLVRYDTFAALELLERSSSRLSPMDEVKVRHFTELMNQDGALDRLLHILGFDS